MILEILEIQETQEELGVPAVLEALETQDPLVGLAIQVEQAILVQLVKKV